MKLVTSNKNVLVKQFEDQKNESDGIIFHRGGKKSLRPENGIIVGVGDKEQDLKIGDRVFFGIFSGVRTSYDGNEYLLLSRKEIMGVFSDIPEIRVLETTNMDGLLDGMQRQHEKMIDKSVRST